jgi:hypothetical protein
LFYIASIEVWEANPKYFNLVLQKPMIGSVLHSFSTGLNLSSEDYHPDLVDLSMLWSNLCSIHDAPFGFTEKIVIPPFQRHTLSRTDQPTTIGQLREQLLLPDEYTVLTQDTTYFGFDEQNFNRFMQLTYSYPDTFSDAPAIWNLLHSNTLTDYIEILARRCSESVLTVTEMGCGYCSDRWIAILKGYRGKKPIQLFLMDFNEDIAKAEAEKITKAVPKVNVSFARYDCIHDDIGRVPKSMLIIGFYFLDSVNFEGDYIERNALDCKVNGFSPTLKGRQLYRIRVSPYIIGESQAKKIATILTEYFKGNTPLPPLNRQALEAICLERVIKPEPTDPDYHYTQRLAGWNVVSSGTIAYIQKLQNRLVTNGKIIFGDTFTDEKELQLIESIGQRGIVTYKRPEIEHFTKCIQNVRFIRAGEFARELRVVKNQSLLFRFFGREYHAIDHNERVMEISEQKH